jgi:hypothetical protein
MLKRTLQLLVALAGCSILFSGFQAWAQYTDGSIYGTVIDPSGASLMGAKVRVTNSDTGVVFNTTTSTNGDFRAVQLRPGRYQVRVEHGGFKAAQRSEIVVNVNTVTRVDFTLEVGIATEVVEVSGGVPLVQTEESRLADIIDTRQVSELPLNGREVYQLLTLQPGVMATNAPSNSSVPSTSSPLTFNFGFTSNGATPRANSFVMDGMSNNNEWLGGTPLITPNIDAIQEFQIQTLNFSAEFGHSDGAIANVVTKYGGNAFHGSAYDFLRNSALNARNYFDAAGSKAPVVQNLFGVSLGGPIKENNTFFFVSYEGSRRKDGSPALFTVETPEFRNLVETSRPNTLAAKFLKDFPSPSCNPAYPKTDAGSIPALATANALSSPGPKDGIPDYCTASAAQIGANDNDQYMVRIDHKPTDHDQLYGRWINSIAAADVSRGQLSGANLRGFSAPLSGFFADLNLGYTRTFSQSMLNDLRFAYSRNNSRIGFNVPVSSASGQELQQAGTPNAFADLFMIDGVVPVGGELYVPRSFVFNTFSVADTLSKILGPHSLKFGIQFRRVQENSDYPIATNEALAFVNVFNFANDMPLVAQANVNRDPTSSQFGRFVGTPRHYRWNQPAAFVQDDWKVRKNLTLNIGLRWERYGSPTETNGLLANMIFPSGLDVTQAQIISEMPQANVGAVKQLWRTRNKNFAPRIGLSWDPFGTGSTAIRAGYAIAYQEAYSNLYTNTRLDPPYASLALSEPLLGVGHDINYVFPFQPSPDFAAPVSAHGGIQGTQINPEGVLPSLKTAYAEQWFFGIQREFLHLYAISINYVGTRGIGNYTRENYNRYTGEVCNATMTRCPMAAIGPNPDFSGTTFVSNEGSSIYHGMNAQLRKMPSHGISFQANYTLGKTLDNVTEGGLGDYGNVNSYGSLYVGAQDISNINADYGPSEFDVRQRFTLTAIWELPHGHFKGPLEKVLGGWQLNGILSMQTGRPFDVFCSLAWYQGCDFNMDGLSYDRPNAPTGSVPRSGYGKTQFVNGVFGSTRSTAIKVFCPNGLVAFYAGTPCVPLATNGNLGRNSFRGPGFQDVDMSLFKNTKIHERVNVQFRAEAFNLFNRTNLYNPAGDMGSPFFGKSTRAFAARQFQFGLKFLF